MAFLDTIKTEIQTICAGIEWMPDTIELVVSSQPDHGDVSLNMAFGLAKQLKMAPHIIATTLSDAINHHEHFTATPMGGYVNITLSNAFLLLHMRTILDAANPPRVSSDHRILLEYVSANPTGPLHIGHGRWAVIGDSLYRLMRAVGLDVDHEFYVNDYGNQIHLLNQSCDAIIKGTPPPDNAYGGDYVGSVARRYHRIIEENNTHESKVESEDNRRCPLCGELFQVFQGTIDRGNDGPTFGGGKDVWRTYGCDTYNYRVVVWLETLSRATPDMTREWEALNYEIKRAHDNGTLDGKIFGIEPLNGVLLDQKKTLKALRCLLSFENQRGYHDMDDAQKTQHHDDFLLDPTWIKPRSSRDTGSLVGSEEPRDCWFRESWLHRCNDKILDTIQATFGAHVYDADGAIWFRTTDLGDDKDRVIRKENGDLTYFAADIAYHLNKLHREYTTLINIWGADHHGYVARINAIIHLAKPDTRFHVILGQLVHLYRNGEPVKMSKRTGDLVELNEVIDEIGEDATRYFLVEKKPDLKLEFDLEEAKEQSMNNPVFYIQYAHARICNILAKVETVKTASPSPHDDPLNQKDRQLMMMAVQYYDVLYDIAKTYDIHKLAHYLRHFCKTFHSFYKTNHVVYDGRIHGERLDILTTCQSIIQHALRILGITCPNNM